MAWRKSCVAAGVVLGEERVAVELDAAQAAAEARAAARRQREAGRAGELDADAVLQRQEVGGGAVDLGAADDDAGLDAHEAGGEADVVADALIGAGGDERGAGQLADGDGAREVGLGAGELGARRLRLLGEERVEAGALDDAQTGDGAQVGGQGLAQRLADVARVAREIGERQHRDRRRRDRRRRGARDRPDQQQAPHHRPHDCR